MAKQKKIPGQLSLFEEPVGAATLPSSTGTSAATGGTTSRGGSVSADLSKMSLLDLTREQIIRDVKASKDPDESEWWKQFYTERAEAFREELRRLQSAQVLPNVSVSNHEGAQGSHS